MALYETTCCLVKWLTYLHSPYANLQVRKYNTLINLELSSTVSILKSSSMKSQKSSGCLDDLSNTLLFIIEVSIALGSRTR